MATKTKYYSLVKPASTEKYAIKTFNDNADLIDTALYSKVDKVTGKGLSTNDYTTAEKNKLNDIEEGANVNVQADWEDADTSSDAYIKNKPTMSDYATTAALAGKLNTSGTAANSKKLGGTTASAFVTTATLSNYATTASLADKMSTNAVSVTQTLTSGTEVGKISVNGTSTTLYAPEGGGSGGSTVSVTQKLTSGTEIATITVDGAGTKLYAPASSTVVGIATYSDTEPTTASVGDFWLSS